MKKFIFVGSVMKSNYGNVREFIIYMGGFKTCHYEFINIGSLEVW